MQNIIIKEVEVYVDIAKNIISDNYQLDQIRKDFLQFLYGLNIAVKI